MILSIWDIFRMFMQAWSMWQVLAELCSFQIQVLTMTASQIHAIYTLFLFSLFFMQQKSVNAAEYN